MNNPNSPCIKFRLCLKTFSTQKASDAGGFPGEVYQGLFFIGRKKNLKKLSKYEKYFSTHFGNPKLP